MKVNLLKDIARLNLPIYRYNSGNVEFLYAGYSPVKKEYFRRMLVHKCCDQEYLGRKWFWQIPRAVRNNNPDLIVTEVSRFTRGFFSGHRGFMLPEWVTMRINIARPLAELCNNKTSDFSNVKRLIKKYNLTYELRDDPQSLDFFIERLYLPYARKRFGEGALIEDLRLYWRSFENHFLIFIREDGELTAGVVCRKDRESIYLRALGLLDGEITHRTHGAIGAIYYFGILEGQKAGLKYLNVGGTHPFLTDRLTRYKLGLDAEVIPDRGIWRPTHWMGVNEGSAKAVEFIRDNPFWALDRNNNLVLSNNV